MADRDENRANGDAPGARDGVGVACDVLERVAESLRREIGPAVTNPFARTQAFMAAVVVEKIARELRLQRGRAQADLEEAAALVADLEKLLRGPIPAALRAALAHARDGSAAGFCRLVEGLYSAQGELAREPFAMALARVRRSLRARIDRQIEYAK